MTSQEFMEREFDNPGKEKHFSSIYKDSHGTIYSYGTHYPLLFKIGMHTFVNNAGYSNTTAKHIGWARGAVNYEAISVQLDYESRRIITSYRSDGEKMETIVKCLKKERQSIVTEMASKRRKDTNVYRWLEDDLQRVDERLGALQTVGMLA